MAVRRLNTIRWQNASGEDYHSYEEWRLSRAANASPSVLLSGRDSIGGIPAPSGFLWVKWLEVHPPADGDGWQEV